MSRRTEPRRRGRDGSVMILVAASLAALMAFGILAIDGVILMTTKTQLQNAADAAALAGASGLPHSQAVATQRAIDYAAFNQAVQEDMAPCIITEEDVTFPTPTRVHVVTHRTAATGDPLRTYFLRLIDLARPNTADVTAEAEAEMAPMCGSDCLKPWAVPDRWNDVDGDGLYDVGEPYDPVTTGYMPPGDVGVNITLKVGNPAQTVESGHFFAVDYPPLGGPDPPIHGGDQYREWIATCCPYTIEVGDSLDVEPGNMVGPTMQGVRELIALDPGAYWDPANNVVAGSAFGTSPRIVKVPFYNPTLPPHTGRFDVHVTKIGAFFLASAGPGSQVNAYFMQLASPGTPCDPNAPGSFIIGLALVE